MFQKELEQAFDQFLCGERAERDPANVDGVAPRCRGRVAQHAHLEVEDDEMMVGGDPFRPTEQCSAANMQAGLLAHLALHGVHDGLSSFDPSARDRPPAGFGCTPPTHEQKCLAQDGDGTGGDDRARKLAAITPSTGAVGHIGHCRAPRRRPLPLVTPWSGAW
jgi:hypothetical protein